MHGEIAGGWVVPWSAYMIGTDLSLSGHIEKAASNLPSDNFRRRVACPASNLEIAPNRRYYAPFLAVAPRPYARP